MKAVLTILFVLATTLVQAQTSTLTVTVTAVKNNTGKVMLALHNKAEGFPGSNAVTYQAAYIQNNQAVFKLEKVAYGTYAISVYHDENSNGKLDTNFMGIPKEAYGASNNAKGGLGPPKYNDAKFELNSAEKSIVIKMQ
jgi:uncharacterized protein (DUF2141 family)